jgi:suppressor of G2 allele of SKP1
MNSVKDQKNIPDTPVAASSAAGGSPVSTRVRHEWFQSEEYMTVSVFIKNVKQEMVEVGFSERALSVTIKMPTGSDFSLELDPLAHEIIPAQSSFVVMSTKVEIKMKKAKVGIKWGSLEGEDALPGIIGGGQGESVKYPSSSKYGTKNWDQLERDVEKDDSDKPEGDRALNALFQQIYKNADEDTKRAMVKSFTESSGTTLSTNWGDVGKGTVETKPPEGMLAKKYGI